MKNLKRYFVLILILLFSSSSQILRAQETNIMIRVQSKDAKFIGSSIGGAKIIVTENMTGKILAEGITSGSTGDTEIIMNEPVKRGQRLSDEDTAGFMASFDIEEPVFVTIEALAPVNKKQALVRSTTQLWVIPGKDITGDGIVLTVPGFVVDILSPQTHEIISPVEEITIQANVVLMCGCPVTEGGMWDASKYEVKALITENGEIKQSIDLKVAQKPSTFNGKATLAPGNYQITVYAFDPVAGNTGVDKTNIIIR